MYVSMYVYVFYYEKKEKIYNFFFIQDKKKKVRKPHQQAVEIN